jgi:peptidyl-prolyl cis-trans isomerase C
MRYLVALCFILFVSFNSIYAEEQAQPATPKGEPVEIKVATVNDQPIFMSDLTREMRMAYPRLDPKNKDAYLKARDDVLDSLINQELLYQEGKKDGLEVSDSDVNEQISKIKEGFPTPEAFEQLLKAQNLTVKRFTTLVKHIMTMTNTIKTKVQPLAKPVTDKDIQDYYEANKDKFSAPEQVKVRHILIKVSPDATEQVKTDAKNKIQSILQEARNGADFSELAKKDSQCPSAQQGGDLGYFTRGQMVKPFEDAAFALQPGQISDVVETEFGYHIIYLDDKKPSKQMEFDEVKDRIKEALTNEAIDKALADWLKPLKESASIKIMLKSDAEPQKDSPEQ